MHTHTRTHKWTCSQERMEKPQTKTAVTWKCIRTSISIPLLLHIHIIHAPPATKQKRIQAEKYTGGG